jgi:4-hydroxy-3-polyprenylbenzoate decarboxylase
LTNLGSKLGIDATTKWKEEGYTREIPKLAQADADTKAIVDNNWKKYGLQ